MRKCVWFVIYNWQWWCCLTLWLYEVSWLLNYCLLVPSCNKHHLLLPPASFCYTQPFCTRKLNYRTLLTFKHLNVWLLYVLFWFYCLFVSVDLNKDMVYFKKKKGNENSYKKASTKWQKNMVCTVKDLSSTLQKQNVPQVQYMNISEGWLSSDSSYFLLLGIKSSLPTKFWCTYLSVEDCCCCCCCCCCWMEPDDDRWDSLLEVCLWVLSGLDCCWSKPSGLWRILVIVMPSLPPPIPESFFLEMFCSSGEYS